MKKGMKLLIFSIIPIILLMSLVAAIQPAPPVPGTNLPANPFQGISELLTGVLKTVGDVFGMAVGKEPFGLAEEIFSRMIIFLLLTAILYMPASKLAKNKAISFIIAAGVSLLGVRFIDATIVNAVLLPYGVLAIALSTMLPLILYGFFIYNEDIPAFIRKAGWWFFVACFLALFIWRAPTVTDSTALSMYLLSGGLAVFAAIVDRPLKAQIDKLKLNLQDAEGKIKTLEEEKMKYEAYYDNATIDLDRSIKNGTATGSELAKKQAYIAGLEKALKGIMKSLSKQKSKK